MVEPRIIKTDEQYRRFLSELERLAEQDPDPATDDGARLEVLAKLVEDYEKTAFPFDRPDPVDAILFRMEQQGLRQKDIADLLGGKNRASEILSRKRQLTLSMIRALHDKLDLPASLLIREPEAHYSTGRVPDDVPTEEIPIDLKHTATFGRNRRTNLTNVWLWLARIRDRADAANSEAGPFDRSALNEDLIRYVARLSWMTDGPRSAVRFLGNRGIVVVIEPHLPFTHIDGAALLSGSGMPVIGLTLREDRLDNFWFTLIHELVHVWKHLSAKGYRAIVDERIEKRTEEEGIEKEANDIAAEILIPRAQWKRSRAYLQPTSEAIHELASELQVSPAIVAGRIRHERANFALFSKLVGHHQARIQFPDVRWN